VEYRACTFQGPANPMVHAVGGRFSLEGCHFRSEPIAGAVRRARLDDSLTVRETTATGRFPDERQVASTSGLDIFIDNPPLDCTEDGVPCVPDRNGFTVSPACFTARDVLSESPQFLATFNDTQRASGTQAATVLQGVRHVPPEGAARPSVHWKGPAEARCALSMMGCEFNTVLVLAAAPLAPVIDLGNRVTAGPTLFTARLGISPGRLFALSR